MFFSSDDILVSIGGLANGRFQPTGRLVAFGGLGNDRIRLGGNVELPGWLHGQSGSDWIKGGRADDVLVGRSGRDIMIGGFGRDRIVGNADDDILIAGHSTLVDDDVALLAIQREWTSSRSYDSRRANILGIATNSEFADRLNGGVYLLIDNIIDDDARDVLKGAQGQDWFFANIGETGVKDRIRDLSEEEFADALDWILED